MPRLKAKLKTTLKTLDRNVLFPPYISSHFIEASDGLVSELFEEEKVHVEYACEKRVKEFSAGRMAARRVLRELKVKPCAIGAEVSRAPIWPEGCTGSISHSHGKVIAVACSTRDYHCLGLDIESMGRVWRLDYKKMILRPYEIEKMSRVSLGEDAYTTLIFSAKEAFYKAQYTVYKQWLNFLDAEINIDESTRRFSIKCEKVDQRVYQFQGWFWVFGDCVISFVAARVDD